MVGRLNADQLEANGKTLGFQLGNGTTIESRSYEFHDSEPLADYNYYRLKQIDFDGTFKYSLIEVVEIDKENKIELYPNPTDGLVYIQGTESDNSEIQILDRKGNLVTELNASLHQIDLSIYPDGLYYIWVKDQQQSVIKRVIKQ